MFWRKILRQKKNDQKAQGMVEYALVIAFVVALGIVLLAVRPELSETIGNVLDNAVEVLGFSSSS